MEAKQLDQLLRGSYIQSKLIELRRLMHESNLIARTEIRNTLMSQIKYNTMLGSRALDLWFCSPDSVSKDDSFFF